VLPADEVLRMATVYGAEAIGHGGELGIVKEGALADLILIDIQKPHLQPVNNLVADLVYCCKSSDVETVIVDGRVVVENRRLAEVDLSDLYRRATAAVERIKKAMR
jgi:5-methylthioadenosine/S-adenosylhomocysteine deaminase